MAPDSYVKIRRVETQEQGRTRWFLLLCLSVVLLGCIGVVANYLNQCHVESEYAYLDPVACAENRKEYAEYSSICSQNMTYSFWPCEPFISQEVFEDITDPGACRRERMDKVVCNSYYLQQALSGGIQRLRESLPPHFFDEAVLSIFKEHRVVVVVGLVISFYNACYTISVSRIFPYFLGIVIGIWASFRIWFFYLFMKKIIMNMLGYAVGDIRAAAVAASPFMFEYVGFFLWFLCFLFPSLYPFYLVLLVLILHGTIILYIVRRLSILFTLRTVRRGELFESMINGTRTLYFKRGGVEGPKMVSPSTGAFYENPGFDTDPKISWAKNLLYKKGASDAEHDSEEEDFTATPPPTFHEEPCSTTAGVRFKRSLHVNPPLYEGVYGILLHEGHPVKEAIIPIEKQRTAIADTARYLIHQLFPNQPIQESFVKRDPPSAFFKKFIDSSRPTYVEGKKPKRANWWEYYEIEDETHNPRELLDRYDDWLSKYDDGYYIDSSFDILRGKPNNRKTRAIMRMRLAGIDEEYIEAYNQGYDEMVQAQAERAEELAQEWEEKNRRERDWIKQKSNRGERLWSDMLDDDDDPGYDFGWSMNEARRKKKKEKRLLQDQALQERLTKLESNFVSLADQMSRDNHDFKEAITNAISDVAKRTNENHDRLSQGCERVFHSTRESITNFERVVESLVRTVQGLEKEATGKGVAVHSPQVAKILRTPPSTPLPPPPQVMPPRPTATTTTITTTTTPPVKEAFNPQNPPYPIPNYVVRCLDKDGQEFQHAIVVAGGILTTAHDADRLHTVEAFNGVKTLVGPKVTRRNAGTDLVWLSHYPGVAGVSLTSFKTPEIGENVAICDIVNKTHSVGKVVSVGQTELNHDLSTTFGACGSPILTPKGMIVGVHNADKTAQLVSSELLQFFRNAGRPQPQRRESTTQRNAYVHTGPHGYPITQQRPVFGGGRWAATRSATHN